MTSRTSQYRTSAPDLIELTPAADRVLNAIRAAGGRPLIVGGAVRDALLGERSPKDIDIEVYGGTDTNALLRELRRVGTADERGVSFGVIAVRVGYEDFDVSLPRRDSKTGAGHRGFDVEVDAGLDERTAFGRRDFTLNALGFDPTTGELVDPWGGLSDLKAGILRHTTDAFTDDPLRVLRGVQFVSRYGFTIAPETLALCRTTSHRFNELSIERVWGEWRKIAVRGLHISKALLTLEDAGWLTHFPELAATRGVPQDPAWHPEGDVFTHLGLAADAAAASANSESLDPDDRALAVLAALAHDLGKPATTTVVDGRVISHGHATAGGPAAHSFMARIGAPGYLQTRVAALASTHMAHTSQGAQPSASSVRRLIRRLDAEMGVTIYDWARVVDADCAGRGSGSKPSPAAAWIAIASQVGPTPRKGLLTGNHLIDAGMTPGPEFKEILAAALSAQDDGEFADEDGALAWLTLRRKGR